LNFKSLFTYIHTSHTAFKDRITNVQLLAKCQHKYPSSVSLIFALIWRHFVGTHSNVCNTHYLQWFRHFNN